MTLDVLVAKPRIFTNKAHRSALLVVTDRATLGSCLVEVSAESVGIPLARFIFSIGCEAYLTVAAVFRRLAGLIELALFLDVHLLHMPKYLLVFSVNGHVDMSRLRTMTIQTPTHV